MHNFTVVLLSYKAMNALVHLTNFDCRAWSPSLLFRELVSLCPVPMMPT